MAPGNGANHKNSKSKKKATTATSSQLPPPSVLSVSPDSSSEPANTKCDPADPFRAAAKIHTTSHNRALTSHDRALALCTLWDTALEVGGKWHWEDWRKSRRMCLQKEWSWGRCLEEGRRGRIVGETQRSHTSEVSWLAGKLECMRRGSDGRKTVIQATACALEQHPLWLHTTLQHKQHHPVPASHWHVQPRHRQHHHPVHLLTPLKPWSHRQMNASLPSWTGQTMWMQYFPFQFHTHHSHHATFQLSQQVSHNISEPYSIVSIVHIHIYGNRNEATILLNHHFIQELHWLSHGVLPSHILILVVSLWGNQFSWYCHPSQEAFRLQQPIWTGIKIHSFLTSAVHFRVWVGSEPVVRTLFPQCGCCHMRRGAHGVSSLNTPDLQNECLVVFGKSFK